MIHPIMSWSIGSNSYIIGGRNGALIDSGINPEIVLEMATKLNIDIKFLINTHCHYDHTAGNSLVKERTSAKIAMHELDLELMGMEDGSLAGLFGEMLHGFKVDMKLKDKQAIDFSGVKLEVLHTPGHTPGGICLYEAKSRSLFSGDTIFSNGVGRTDLPGGDSLALKNSLKRLIKLNKKRGIDTIYPGHGPLGEGKDIERIYEIYFEE